MLVQFLEQFLEQSLVQSLEPCSGRRWLHVGRGAGDGNSDDVGVKLLENTYIVKIALYELAA